MLYDCLIVEDEKVLADNTCRYLNLSDVNTYAVYSVSDYRDFMAHHDARVVLLDVNLGDGNGYNLCRQLREESGKPIIFVSGQTEEENIVLGLNLGGDDFVCKPYSLQILLAKVKAALRRTSEKDSMNEICFGKCRIIFSTETVFRENEEISLRGMERKLLLYMIKNRNRVITKQELFKEIWDDSFVGDNTLNVHIRKLREKLEDDPSKPEYIITEYGKGYIFRLKE